MVKLITNVRLNPDQKAELDRIAAETGLTPSVLIRACINRALPYVEAKAKEAANGDQQ